MGLLFCLKRKKKVKLFAWGDTVSCLTMTTSVCKAVAEKISSEKGISEAEAMNIVVESVAEVHRTVECSK